MRGGSQAYPMAKSCSGFWPSPFPPILFGVANFRLRGTSPSDFTVPLRPSPIAVALETYCDHGFSRRVPLRLCSAHQRIFDSYQCPPGSNREGPSDSKAGSSGGKHHVWRQAERVRRLCRVREVDHFARKSRYHTPPIIVIAGNGVCFR